MGVKTTTTWGHTQADKFGDVVGDDIKDRLRAVEVVALEGMRRAKGEVFRLTRAPGGRVTATPRDDDGAADVAADIAAERDEAREAASSIEGERNDAIEALVACEGAVDSLTDVVERLLSELRRLRDKYDEACDDVTRVEDELDRAREALQEVRNG